MKKLMQMLPLLAISFLTIACDSNDDNDSGATDLALSFSGLEPVVNGFHYEGWAIVDGAAVTTGKFNVDAAGGLVDLNGNALTSFDTGTDLTNATAIVLTIEPAGDTDTVPSSTHVLGGSVTNGRATLSADHATALNAEYNSAAGRFILATPTGTEPSTSGVWFLDNSSGSAVAGLDLPALPAGWYYEGWAVINGSPLSTGTFTAVDAADMSAPFSGENAGPNYPGEDFLVNAPAGVTFPTDLSGLPIVISIEPFPDDSPAPYTFKPLVGMSPTPGEIGTVYDMGNNIASFPSGSATIR